MARLYTGGAELGHAQADGLTINGAPTIDTAVKRTGAASYKATAVNAYHQRAFTGVLDRAYFFRCYYQFSNNPTGLHRLAKVMTAAAGGILFLEFLNGSRVLRITNSAGTVQATGTIVLNAGTWYQIEIMVDVPAAGNTPVEIRVDGVTEISGSFALGNTAPGQYRFGCTDGNLGGITALYYDDIAINDDQGSDQNSWPGAGSVYALLGAADPGTGTATTNWTKPGGATTNRHTSVGKPLVYQADSTSSADAEKFVRNPTNAASQFEIDVTDYTTAGIPAGDAIALVQPVAGTGSTSATDTTGSLEGLSNPVVASKAMTTFDNGIASATVTTWPRTDGNVVYNPSVTRGTRPRVRLARAAANRIVMCNLLALLVETSPPATIPISSGDTSVGADAQLVSSSSVSGDLGTGLNAQLANGNAPSVLFDGIDDRIITSVGGANITGNFMAAAIIKRNAMGGNREVIISASTTWYFSLDNNSQIELVGDSITTSPGGMLVTPSDGWVLIVVTKAAGTIKPRFHKYSYATGIWTHADAVSTLTDWGVDAVSALSHGRRDASQYAFNGNILISGMWGTDFSDSAVEALQLQNGLQEWVEANPIEGWRFDKNSGIEAFGKNVLELIDHSTEIAFGYSTSREINQGFLARGNKLEELKLWLKTVGTPPNATGVQIQICTDSGGYPNTVVGTLSIPIGSLSTTMTQYTWSGLNITLVPGNTYHILVQPDPWSAGVGGDSSNCFIVALGSPVIDGFSASYDTGSVWQPTFTTSVTVRLAFPGGSADQTGATGTTVDADGPTVWDDEIRTPVAAADTGTGTESQSVIQPISVNSADTGTSVESATISISISASDTGAGVNNQILTAVFTSADFNGATTESITLVARTTTGDVNGTVTEIGTIAVPVPASDVGAGVDVTTLKAVYASADTASDTESATLAPFGISSSDAGVGVDAQTPKAAYASAEIGSATDAITNRKIDDAEIAVGADGQSIITPGAAVDNEIGSGADTATVTKAVLTATETGTDTEATTLVFRITTPDINGVITESGSVSIGIVPISASDTGTSVESATVSVPVTASDTAVGVEVISALRLTSADTGAGIETTVPVTAISSSDSALGSQAQTEIVNLTAADTATSVETASGGVPISTADSAIGTDSASVVAATSKSSAEIATGTDSAAVTRIVQTTADTGVGIQATSLSAALSDLQTGSGSDSASMGKASLTTAESGLGIEQRILVARLFDFDVSIGIDVGLLETGYFMQGDESVILTDARIDAVMVDAVITGKITGAGATSAGTLVDAVITDGKVEIRQLSTPSLTNAKVE